MTYDPGRVGEFQSVGWFSVANQMHVDPAALATNDADILREPRVLVPIDVQALVVPPAGLDTVNLPGPLTPGHSEDVGVVDGPDPLSAPTPLGPGVHLQWAMPDGLLRGVLRDPRGNTGGGLALAVLPDKFVVLRLLAGEDGSSTHVRGWLIDAARAEVRDLAGGPESAPLPAPPARVVAPAELTGTAGGSLTWTGEYAASFARLAWHDTLEDLAADPTLGGALPGGPVGSRATYLVVGWWSDPALDPLDDIRSTGGLTECLGKIGWQMLPGERPPAPLTAEVGAQLGLTFRRREGPVITTRRSADRRSDALPEYFAKASPRASIGGALFREGVVFATRPSRPTPPEASTLVHGAVVSVPLPVVGASTDPDLRPSTAEVIPLLGEHLDDLVSAGVGLTLDLEPEDRAGLERLVHGFTNGTLGEVGTPDGQVAVDERVHAAGFVSVDPHEPPLIDRVLTGRAAMPPRTPRPRATSGTREPQIRTVALDAEIRQLIFEERKVHTVDRTADLTPPPPPPSPVPAEGPPQQPGEQVLRRPTPLRWQALDPMVGLAGARRSLRHGGDGRGDPNEQLGCRRPSQVITGYAGVVSGSTILPSLGSGAVPTETLALAQESLLLSPHLIDWLAKGVEERTRATVDVDAGRRRLGTEMLLRYDADGGYLGKAAPRRTLARGDVDARATEVSELLRRHSLVEGVEPDPVAITSWAQPWLPMWLEWEVEVTACDDLAGWDLGAVDLVGPTAETTTGTPLTTTGRTVLTAGPASAVRGALTRWLTQEDERDALNVGVLDDDFEQRLARLAVHGDRLDLLGCPLDGVRRALLGLPRSQLLPRAPDGSVAPTTPSDLPRLLTGGNVRLLAARVVDAFGRILEVDLDLIRVSARLTSSDHPGALVRAPRFTAPTRCLARFVDPAATDPESAVDAVVDEVEPPKQISPVVGFLLPDHVDESIEVFAADGAPVGELTVDSRTGGVVWECAPGRSLPADAPPGAGLAPAQAALGRFAAGLVAADSQARNAHPPPEPFTASTNSALSAFLRAVDTTLWTTDPIAGAGSSGFASIIGRPVAMVRLTIELDIADDLDDLSLSTDQLAERALAYGALARVGVPVRVGELTRSDDGVLGWFADDDYRRFHLVDKAVADIALGTGKLLGFLAALGEAAPPTPDPISHDYLELQDELVFFPGTPRMLTVLMLPGSAVTLTAGLVPRQSLRLSRAWFADGLERISPSVRVGPVLVDPGEVRLPPVAALDQKQVLTSRDGPLGWRDDAILAATQTAYLPDRAAVLREGWIRVAPPLPDAGAVAEPSGGPT